MATHSSILAWRISLAKEPGGLQSMGHMESDMTEQLGTLARTREYSSNCVSAYNCFIYFHGCIMYQ